MLGKPQLHELYFYLQLNRRVEEELARMWREGLVAASLYPSRGQEAVSVGAAYALGPGDLLAPALRDLGALLVRGIRPVEIFAHFLGTRHGPTGGRTAALEMGDLARGLVAPIGPLAAQVGVMAGVALAARLRTPARVALTFVGDGAMATGDFHEGLNFAAVHRLPLVVVVENNRYAFSTPAARIWGSEDLYQRSRGYGLPGMPVDGSDILQVLQVTGVAIERARAGKGPTLIEAKAHRLSGHMAGDEQLYLPEEERQPDPLKDPLTRFATFLSENQLIQESERRSIELRVEEVVVSARRQAEADEAPDPESLAAGVYQENV
jgi:TPP-dependent pyruvate/acetoin dehydrogenase alpha subunit